MVGKQREIFTPQLSGSNLLKENVWGARYRDWLSGGLTPRLASCMLLNHTCRCHVLHIHQQTFMNPSATRSVIRNGLFRYIAYDYTLLLRYRRLHPTVHICHVEISICIRSPRRKAQVRGNGHACVASGTRTSLIKLSPVLQCGAWNIIETVRWSIRMIENHTSICFNLNTWIPKVWH